MGVRAMGRWLLGGVTVSVAGLMLAVGGAGAVASAEAAPGPRAGAEVTRPGVPAKIASARSDGTLPDLPELYGVSCPSASWCMAVGRTDGGGLAGVSGIWDGHGWQWLPDPAPSGKLAVFDLTSVSCVSQTSCVAIGSGPFGVPVGIRWNGKSWAFMPWIANRRSGSENAVSCVTATYCVVAGSVDLAHVSAAALLWNGTSWQRLGAALPAGANSISFSSVSCTSKTACVAVGTYRIGTASNPVAESWNGSTWTSYPVPLNIQTLTSVSCPQAGLCLATGTKFITGPGFEPATARWNGTRLTELTTPSPGGLLPGLNGISCGSPVSCIAVGATNVSEPFTEKWTAGAGWKLLSTPAHSSLFAVSCPQATACLATGDYFDADFWADATAMSWNGGTWKVIRQVRSDVLASVSCPDNSACLSAGVYLSTSDAPATLAQAWNGREWRSVNPAGAPGGAASVSCVTRSFCVAATEGGTVSWNGTRWSALSQAGGGFSEVSCVTTRFCQDTNGSTYAVWRGQNWRDVPAPASSGEAQILGVSCASTTLCLGYGSYYDSDGNQDGGFLDQWNGSRWRLAGLPSADTSDLDALSCAHGSWCLAIGSNVALRLSSGKWLVTEASLPDAVDYVTLSCASASMCMAISGNQTGLWNGKSWKLAKITRAPGLLFGVSCTGPAFCLAVGQRDGLLSLTERWNGHNWQPLTEPNP